LQMSDEDGHWQFVSWCLDLLAQASCEDSCDLDTTYLRTRFSPGQITTHVFGHADPQSFRVRFWPKPLADRNHFCIFSAIPTTDLFHRLSGGPGLLSSVSMAFGSKDHTKWQDLKVLAATLFTHLQDYEGFLVVHLMNSDAVPAALMVTHRDSVWTIGHEDCIVCPPKLDFDMMPRNVSSVEARIYSKGSAEKTWLRDTLLASDGAEFDPEFKQKMDFAYIGNVDIEAWVAEQREHGIDAEEYMNVSDYNSYIGHMPE